MNRPYRTVETSARASRVRGLLNDLRTDVWTPASPLERRCLLVGALLMLSGVVHIGVFAALGGPWEGPVSFRKAVTFGLAFGLTVITVTWVQRVVALSNVARKVLLLAFVTACVVEVVLVTMQAWRDVPSHFNRDSPFDSAVSTVLAAGGFVIVATTAVTTCVAVRTPPRATPLMSLAVRAGYLGFLLALVVGAVMIARGVSLERTGSATEAYHHAGSLKPAHADTMHAILILPVIAWLLDRSGWSGRTRMRLLALAVAGYGLTAVVVLVEAVRSANPLRPAAISLVSAVGVAVLVAVAVAAVIGALARRDESAGAAHVESRARRPSTI